MKIIRDVAVAEKLGTSTTTVWRKSKNEPDFPKPVRLSDAITGWLESEVDDYIARKVRESREQPPRKREVAVKAMAASAAARRAKREAEGGHVPA